jgi:mono/diheme cytochrome c family protein
MRIPSTPALMLGLILAGCAGMPSEKPPIHINPNMDWQPKFGAQSPNPNFDDNRTARTPVEGTVARGGLVEDKPPVELTRAFLYRGKERYEIYCSMCHGGTGAGDGIVIGYGYVPPPSFHDERIRSMPDAEIHSAIVNGVRSMPSYRHQVTGEDRWAIVAYIRALQRSQNATAADLQNLNLVAGN